MSTAETAAPTKRKRASASGTFREEYHKHQRISYAEAADLAGVAVATIQNWLCKGRKGVRLRTCAERGPYRIDTKELVKFLRIVPEKSTK